jgi:hypothetical protein
MQTPIRPVRIDDEIWKKAQAIAKDLANETGLSATASDVVRKALVEYIERYKAARRAQKAASESIPPAQ